MSDAPERWHVAQYVDDKCVGHEVYNSYDYAKFQILRKGLRSGTNTLTRPSQCECKGTVS